MSAQDKDDLDLLYKKSNALITSVGSNSNLMSNKLLAVLLSYITNKEYSTIYEADGAASIVVKLPASHLRELFGRSGGGSFYQELEQTSQNLVSRSIGVTDEETQSFIFISILSSAKYENGVLTIRFNSEMSKFLLTRRNYTLLSLSAALKFRHNIGYRLYELCKAKYYLVKNNPAKWYKVDGEDAYGREIELRYGLNELKFLLGMLDATSTAAKKMLKNGTGGGKPDYDALAEKVPSTHNRWSSVKRSLDAGIQEINEGGEMRITYTTERTGRGGKISAVKFRVIYLDEAKAKEDAFEKPVLSKNEQFALCASVFQATEGTLSLDDIEDLLKIADKDEIAAAYRYMKEKGGRVDNPAAWIRSCLKRDWHKKEQKDRAAEAKKNLSEKKKKTGASKYNELEWLTMESFANNRP